MANDKNELGFDVRGGEIRYNQVCDCCRERRVKCDKSFPCWRCISAGLKCSYSPARRRGPKGKQSAVLKSLRNRAVQQAGKTVKSEIAITEKAQFSFVPLSWATLNLSVVTALLQSYFDYVNPIVPILKRKTVLGYLTSPPTAESYTLVAAAASTVFKRVITEPVKNFEESAREFYLNEATASRGKLPYIMNRTIDSVKIAFLIYLSFCSVEDYDNAWFFLHEAITIARILELDQEAHYTSLDYEQDLDHRLVFWGLYVSERGFCVHEHRPVVLKKSVRLPKLTSKDGNCYHEFVSLAKLMSSLDDDFIQLWNSDARDQAVLQSMTEKSMAIKTLAKTHKNLQGALKDTVKIQSGIQKANVFLTQEWLYLLLWRKSYDGPHSSSASREISIRSQFPIKAATVAMDIYDSVSLPELVSHGPGIRQKFYDVLDCLADFVLFQPQVLGFDISLDKCDLLKRLFNGLISLNDNKKDEYKQLEHKVVPAVQQLMIIGWAPDVLDSETLGSYYDKESSNDDVTIFELDDRVCMLDT